MWTEIDGSVLSDFARFYATQKHMNSYYENKYTSEGMKALFESKSDQNIRAFTYEAGPINLNLCVKKSPNRDGVHIITCGTNTIAGDMDEKASIVHSKVQLLMDEMVETEAWGVWNIGTNYAVGEAFFERFCEHAAATNGAAYGYSACTKEVITGIISTKGILRMYK